MLNFEEFQEKMIEELSDKLTNSTIQKHAVKKNNDVTLNGLLIKFKDSNVAPILYIDSYYEQYLQGNEINNIAENLMSIINNNRGSELGEVVNKFVDYESIKNKIVCTLVNAEKNEEMLKSIPHKKKEDLAVIYKVLIDDYVTATIKNEHLKLWGVNEQELDEIAFNNTKRILPIKVRKINDILNETIQDEGISKEMIEMIYDMPDDMCMYVMTNSSGCYGANAILFEEEFDKLSQKLGDDLYILPSSIHEVIVVSQKLGSSEEFAQMVRDVNEQELEETEKLSDNVYSYSAKTKTISLINNEIEYKKIR